MPGSDLMTIDADILIYDALVVNMMVIVMVGQCTGSCAAAVSRLTHRLLRKSTELLVLVVAF